MVFVSAGVWGGTGSFLQDVAPGFLAGTFGLTGAALQNAVAATQILVHGAVQGVLTLTQGGHFLQGFASGAISEAATIGTRGQDIALRVAAVSAAGGLSAQLTGGKFANGAITAAFAFLYNAGAGHEDDEGKRPGRSWFGLDLDPAADFRAAASNAEFESLRAEILRRDPGNDLRNYMGPVDPADAAAYETDPKILRALRIELHRVESLEFEFERTLRAFTGIGGGRVIDIEGPRNFITEDPCLGWNGYRYQVNFSDEFGNVTNYSVNYSPQTRLYGYIKVGSGKD